MWNWMKGAPDGDATATLDAPATPAMLLTPATVIGSASAGRVDVTPDLGGTGPVRAEAALPLPMELTPGDRVVIVAQADRAYVIGVLQSTGKSVLTFPAGVDFRAPNGEISLHSTQAVRTRAPEVEVKAGRFRITASQLIRRVGSLITRVTEAITLRAKRRVERIEGQSVERAGERSIRTERDVRINGRRIHIG
jgi:hypothetical protein